MGIEDQGNQSTDHVQGLKRRSLELDDVIENLEDFMNSQDEKSDLEEEEENEDKEGEIDEDVSFLSNPSTKNSFSKTDVISVDDPTIKASHEINEDSTESNNKADTSGNVLTLNFSGDKVSNESFSSGPVLDPVLSKESVLKDSSSEIIEVSDNEKIDTLKDTVLNFNKKDDQEEEKEENEKDSKNEDAVKDQNKLKTKTSAALFDDLLNDFEDLNVEQEEEKEEEEKEEEKEKEKEEEKEVKTAKVNEKAENKEEEDVKEKEVDTTELEEKKQEAEKEEEEIVTIETLKKEDKEDITSKVEEEEEEDESKIKEMKKTDLDTNIKKPITLTLDSNDKNDTKEVKTSDEKESKKDNSENLEVLDSQKSFEDDQCDSNKVSIVKDKEEENFFESKDLENLDDSSVNESTEKKETKVIDKLDGEKDDDVVELKSIDESKEETSDVVLKDKVEEELAKDIDNKETSYVKEEKEEEKLKEKKLESEEKEEDVDEEKQQQEEKEEEEKEETLQGKEKEVKLSDEEKEDQLEKDDTNKDISTSLETSELFEDSKNCCDDGNGNHTCTTRTIQKKLEITEKENNVDDSQNIGDDDDDDDDDSLNIDDDIDALLADLDNMDDKDNDLLAKELLEELEPKKETDPKIIKNYTFKIFTSLASMDRHMVSRTNKIISLLLAQEGVTENLLELCDLGTDAEAKKNWYRKALNPNTREPLPLPGLFRKNVEEDLFIGNYEMIEEFNEDSVLEDKLWPELMIKNTETTINENNILWRLLGKK